MLELFLGDCLDQLKNLDDNSVDSIVTDPPYGLSFMGKSWDYEVPKVEIWKECLRVLKPGGHLLSFFGTRTYHRGAVNIEDAGFEIRDQIQWLYGSGFPKSHDISKAIDKAAGAEREVIGQRDVGHEMNGGRFNQGGSKRVIANITNPKTPEAIQWQGWGTALKPANEPIVVARKPLEKGLTVAQNVLKYGTGALNIDGGRIDYDAKDLEVVKAAIERMKKSNNQNGVDKGAFQASRELIPNDPSKGRWPANIILDEVVADTLDSQQIGVSRFFYVAKASKSERNAGLEGMLKVSAPKNGHEKRITVGGSKDTALPRENFHPTVKPIKLMQYLINLVTPPNGIVLDPFMGSGTTGIAAKKLSFGFIGIERDQEYFQIASKRIEVSE